MLRKNVGGAFDCCQISPDKKIYFERKSFVFFIEIFNKYNFEQNCLKIERIIFATYSINSYLKRENLAKPACFLFFFF